MEETAVLWLAFIDEGMKWFEESYPFDESKDKFKRNGLVTYNVTEKQLNMALEKLVDACVARSIMIYYVTNGLLMDPFLAQEYVFSIMMQVCRKPGVDISTFKVLKAPAASDLRYMKRCLIGELKTFDTRLIPVICGYMQNLLRATCMDFSEGECKTPPTAVRTTSNFLWDTFDPFLIEAPSIKGYSGGLLDINEAAVKGYNQLLDGTDFTAAASKAMATIAAAAEGRAAADDDDEEYKPRRKGQRRADDLDGEDEEDAEVDGLVYDEDEEEEEEEEDDDDIESSSEEDEDDEDEDDYGHPARVPELRKRRRIDYAAVEEEAERFLEHSEAEEDDEYSEE